MFEMGPGERSFRPPGRLTSCSSRQPMKYSPVRGEPAPAGQSDFLQAHPLERNAIHTRELDAQARSTAQCPHLGVASRPRPAHRHPTCRRRRGDCRGPRTSCQSTQHRNLDLRRPPEPAARRKCRSSRRETDDRATLASSARACRAKPRNRHARARGPKGSWVGLSVLVLDPRRSHRRPLWSGTPRKQLLVIPRVRAWRSLTVRSPNW